MTGSPIYICNNLDRFNSSTYKKNDRINPIFTEDSCSYIKGYGNIKINVTTLTGEGLFKLKNIVYIPGFYTNIMSHRRLRQAGYHWDDVSLQVWRDNTSQTLFYVDEVYD